MLGVPFESKMNTDNDVMEFDIGLAGDGVGSGDDGFEADNQIIDEEMDDYEGFDATRTTHIPLGDSDFDPYDGMEFESEEAAKAFYNSYARRVGFSTRVSSSRRARKDGAIIQRTFVCAKEGFRKPKEKRKNVEREIKRPRAVTRVGCKAALSVKIQDFSGKWVVYGVVKEHNHELAGPDEVHRLRSHRQIAGPAKTLIDTLQAAGMGPRRIMSVLIKEYGGISKVGFTEVDCRNYIRTSKERSMEGEIQPLVDYLKQMQDENPDFFYAVQGGENQCKGNVFWADPRARMNYVYFGDTVIFDTTYRWNKYRLPFASFTGVNHHGQPVLFGCAILVNELEESFVWLFRMWLMAMSGCCPVSITTDHDTVIEAGIKQVFPDARHRFCKWHIFKKCQEKMSHVFLQHPSFEADFHKCINSTDSVDEFESFWFSLVDKYDLGDHDWIQDIYSARTQWVPVYLRDAFFAEMSTTQRRESMNSYFDGYVNASTSFNQLSKLYEKALVNRNEKEVKADFDTLNTPPPLKTPSPMERQAAELYTRKLFARFQEELIGTLTFMASKIEDNGDVIMYRVSKFGEDHKFYYVKFNVLKMRATCSCQMFEFCGLLCRHVLAVFRVTNVLTLPSHYILKRWTRNAKSSIVLEESPGNLFSSYLESHTVRYNTLRNEVFKFVDEGAESVDSYDVALEALQEAVKRVALATKNDGKTPSINGRISRKKTKEKSQANHDTRDHPSSASQLPEVDLDKRIQELTQELESANCKCEAYRTNLLFILKDVDDHRQKLSAKVQNIKLSMKDTL